MDSIKIQDQLDENRRTVAFDSYDITVRQLYSMVLQGEIDISPEYQRHFVWDDERQSALIESIYLGIPVPSLFMATNRDATWEVIDGLQRLTTIINFIGTPEDLVEAKVSYKKLVLKSLDKLDAMNKLSFHDLPSSMRLMFLTRPIRITVLNDRSDLSVRYDLFERLNTGGVTLHEQEIRNCIFLGPFNDFLKELSTYPSFRNVVKMTDSAERKGNYEELVLKFFAYYQCPDKFVHSVKGFLNDYMSFKTENFKDRSELEKVFKRTFDFLADHLPQGIVRGVRVNITPIVLYEAISVGSALALQSQQELNADVLPGLLNDPQLKKYTTGATNSRFMLKQRLELVTRALKNAAE
ncbi:MULTISPECIES: DUF262 domain-containing protein [Aeromonas]|uniref:DUF262 domain-containing protein n=2 Tax=Aeromonadaceae TaxID=84642 RepID=UPI0038CFC649